MTRLLLLSILAALAAAAIASVRPTAHMLGSHARAADAVNVNP